MLVGEDAPHYGEIVVGGLCLAAGYYQYSYLMPLIHVDLPPPISFINGGRQQPYFRTGDFARKLPSGDLIFLGRKDRTVNLNGQRVALEEIESSLLDHPDVVDDAVICHEVEHISTFAAHLVTEKSDQDAEILRSSLRIWLQSKLPQFIIPTRFCFTKSLPLTSSGKVDYVSLANSTYSDGQIWKDIEKIPEDNLIQVVKQVFSDALMVDKVSVDDNFFEMGGSSISAAYVAFKLGVHMQLIYSFPTPRRLQMALSSSSSSLSTDAIARVNLRKLEGDMIRSMDSRINNFHESKLRRRLLGSDSSRDIYKPAKQLKLESNMLADSKKESLSYISWNPTALHTKCSFTRCNKGMHGGQCADNYLLNYWLNKFPRKRKGYMQELWRVNLSSCVDASPLVISKGSDVYLLIGSHSHNFVCIDGISGYMSPEYTIDGLFSVKSDVFSFGVIVLEIISGKRNRGFTHSDHHHNLLGHAWILYREGKSLEIVDSFLENSCCLTEVLRSIHVGLLCVQQSAENWPNMSSVVQMLGNEGALPEAKQPGFFTGREFMNDENSSSSNIDSSTNEMSITLLEPR